MASLKRFATLGAAAAPPPATDSQFNLTTLLLHGDGTNGAQNNTFVDSSSNNFTITRNGNTTQGTFTPFSQTGWSNYFDGTDDYLIIADNAVLQAGTLNFTLEAWLYRGASGSAHTIYAKGGASTGIVFQVTSTNVLRFTHTTTNIDSTGTIAANSWTHVAVVREGTGTNQTKLYINGTQDGQGTVSTDFNQTEQVRIGTDRGATADFNGYISNLRFIKGTALYTTTFTPSTLPLTTTSQGATATEVELLTCQSNRFLDNSSNAFTVTTSGTPSVQAFSPFAPTSAYSTSVVGGSGYFDGTIDFLSVPKNTAFEPSTNGAWCVESWVYCTAASGVNMLWTYGNPTISTGPDVGILGQITPNSSILAGFYSGSTGKTITSPASVAIPNTWIHIALASDGTTMRLFVNGVSVGTPVTVTGNAINAPASATFRLGNYSSNQYLFGYLSNTRFVKGSAVYTANFTPPTAPLTAITNTSFLTNYINAGIIDNTSKNDLETVGNAKISTAVTKFGTGSLAFDGTGDWLTFPNSPITQIGTGDFTIEGWVYINATGVAYGLISKGTSTTGWSVNITSGNKLQFSYTATALTGATSLAANTWYYFTVVRSGTATGNLKVYLNGSIDATSAGAVTDNFNQTSIGYVGADRVGGSALNGYLDDIRVTLAARTITTPTAAFLDQ